MILQSYTPGHIQAYHLWKESGFDSLALTEHQVTLISDEDAAAARHIRRDRERAAAAQQTIAAEGSGER